MTDNVAYELTKPVEVTPKEYKGDMVADCPKCGQYQVVKIGRANRCQLCGMLFHVVSK
jgi:predicted RNA-binding Zn-ribbon protein involved in translation (DUF1610 family)